MGAFCPAPSKKMAFSLNRRQQMGIFNIICAIIRQKRGFVSNIVISPTADASSTAKGTL